MNLQKFIADLHASESLGSVLQSKARGVICLTVDELTKESSARFRTSVFTLIQVIETTSCDVSCFLLLLLCHHRSWCANQRSQQLFIGLVTVLG